MSEKNIFEYNYCASEQQEIKKLREKYISPDKREVTIEDLRRLDYKATEKAMIISLIAGILGTMLLGFGMSVIMTDLGAVLGSSVLCYFIGTLSGLIGIVLVIAAYPLYLRTLKRERERIAPEIIRISDQLMK